MESGAIERQQGMLKAAMQLGCRAGVRIQYDRTGTPLGGIASGASTPPLADVIKPIINSLKQQSRLFHFLLSCMITNRVIYSYHFCK